MSNGPCSDITHFQKSVSELLLVTFNQEAQPLSPFSLVETYSNTLVLLQPAYSLKSNKVERENEAVVSTASEGFTVTPRTHRHPHISHILYSAGVYKAHSGVDGVHSDGGTAQTE